MGNNLSSPTVNKQIKQLLQEYQIIQIPTQNITYLEHKQSSKEFLLREITFNDKKQYEKVLQSVKKKKIQLQNCQHVVPIVKYITNIEDQFCGTYLKIFVLFQYPQRTLDDQINQRNLHKRKFQQKQLWSILASCILGLSHLQKDSIKHSCLRSSTILLSQQGVIRVADPFTTASLPNYDVLLRKRDTPHIYLPPQQAQSLQQEVIVLNHNPYKGDIWTLGMIMLEAGLLQYQDECYRDDGSRIHWQTLNYNINRFGQIYSDELKNMIEFMLSRDERTRPQWIDLQEHVMKIDEDVRGQYISQNEQIDRSQPRYSTNKTTNLISTPPPTHQLNHYQKVQNRTSKNQIPNKVLQYSPSIHSNYPSNHYKPHQKLHNPLINSQLPLRPNNIFPIAVSVIDNTRPLRSIFPADLYIQHTKVDENLVMVEQQQLEITTNNYPNSNNFSPIKQQQQGYRAGYSVPPQSNINNIPQNIMNKDNIYPNTNLIIKNGEPLSRYTDHYQTHSHNNRSTTPLRISNNSQIPMPNISAKPQFKVQIFKMGSKYQGFQVNGMRHGKGKFYYQDGGMYDGDWNYNRMQGFGKLYYQSGLLAYEGQWLKDQFTGYGVLYNQTHQLLNKPFNYINFDDIDQYWTKYQGNFLEDNKHGRGKWYLSNGQYYNGEFKDDMVHGYGVFQGLNGKSVAGYWSRNQLIEQKR